MKQYSKTNKNKIKKISKKKKQQQQHKEPHCTDVFQSSECHTEAKTLEEVHTGQRVQQHVFGNIDVQQHHVGDHREYHHEIHDVVPAADGFAADSVRFLEHVNHAERTRPTK
jgi:hypothetical protein